MPMIKRIYSLYQHFSKKRKIQLFLLLFLMLFSAIIEMATISSILPFLGLLSDPESTHKYINFINIFKLFGTSEDNFLLAATILFCSFVVAGGVIRFLVSWFSYILSAGISSDINVKVFKSTLNRSYAWHISKNSSEILSSIEKVNTVLAGIISPILQGCTALVLSLGILFILLIIDYSTALIAATSFGILYTLTTLLVRKNLTKNGEIIASNMSKRIKSIQEGLGGIRDVLLNNTQKVYIGLFSVFDYSVRRAQGTVQLIGISPRYLVESLGIIMLVILAYWFTGNKGFSSAIPILGALAIGGQKLLPQMQIIYGSLSSIIGAQKSLMDVLKLLNEAGNIEISNNLTKSLILSNKIKKKSNVSIIQLKNISFSYNKSSSKVLHNINLEIKRGSRIGFVGKTGSGKSTLLDIIMGLLKVDEGIIKVDGKNLNQSNLRSWQSRIAHVPQSIFLSDSSIAENIAFGIHFSEIDFERVKLASKQAQLNDFIESLPNQFHTKIGERGIKISGGQRQRIGLARALYKNADILIFDEATSALDTNTERAIITTIQQLSSELTILMIAHRITTLQSCDKIFELKNSKIFSNSSYNDYIESNKNIL